MAGEFIIENKDQNGVYVKRGNIVRNVTNANSIGKVAMFLPLKWGEDVVEINANDISGKGLVEKTGLTPESEEALPIIMALTNCATVRIIKTNVGGNSAVKASTAIQGDGESGAPFTANYKARHSGEFGNKISINIEKVGSDIFNVYTLVQGQVVDRQSVRDVKDLVNNAYVEFVLTGLEKVKGKPRVGTYVFKVGKDGEIVDDISTLFKHLKHSNVDVITSLHVGKDEEKTSILDFIKEENIVTGRKYQLVAMNVEGNDEYLIKLPLQGFTHKDLGDIEDATYVAYIAGKVAGTGANESYTYRDVDGAIKDGILGLVEDIGQAIRDGFTVLTTRSDGTVVFEADINSLPNYGDKLSRTLQSGRNFRAKKLVEKTLVEECERTVIGRLQSNSSALDAVKATVNSILLEHVNNDVIMPFNQDEAITVTFGDEPSIIRVSVNITTSVGIEQVYIYFDQIV